MYGWDLQMTTAGEASLVMVTCRSIGAQTTVTATVTATVPPTRPSTNAEAREVEPLAHAWNVVLERECGGLGLARDGI